MCRVRTELGYERLKLADGCGLELEVELVFVSVEVVGSLKAAGVTLLMTSNGIEVNSLEPKSTRQDQAELPRLQLPNIKSKKKITDSQEQHQST